MKPITREEMYLAKMAGQDVETPEPVTRREMFLDRIAEDGGVKSWNDLTDRPFGENTVMGDTLTWDGNTEGLVSVIDTYYKVSDAVPSVADFANGCECNVLFDGVTGTMSYTAENMSAIADGVLMCSSEAFLVVSVANAALGEIVFPETGVYFMCADGNCVFSLTIPGYGNFETTTIKTIDPKFLPEGVGGGGMAVIDFGENNAGAMLLAIMTGGSEAELPDAAVLANDIDAAIKAGKSIYLKVTMDGNEVCAPVGYELDVETNMITSVQFTMQMAVETHAFLGIIVFFNTNSSGYSAGRARIKAL